MKNAFFFEKSVKIFVGMKKKQYFCTLFRRACERITYKCVIYRTREEVKLTKTINNNY